jgi:hypothetical protein
MNDFRDLLGTSDAPVSKIASLKGKNERRCAEFKIFPYLLNTPLNSI